jgi:hypothetical protein
MIRKGSSFSYVSLGVSAALLALTQAKAAHADEVDPTPKGIIGTGLLGAEVVMLGEAAFGVKSGWAYVIGGVVGAGGGALAGHYIEDGADPKVSLYLLAGGVALVIPTTVAVLSATAYTPPEDYTEDKPASGAPVPEPPRPSPTAPTVPGGGASVPSRTSPLALHYHWQPAKLKLTASLLDLDEGAFKVAMPAVEVRPMYRLDELQKYGLEQKHELRVPVFSATF